MKREPELYVAVVKRITYRGGLKSDPAPFKSLMDKLEAKANDSGVSITSHYTVGISCGKLDNYLRIKKQDFNYLQLLHHMIDYGEHCDLVILKETK
jgi:hypothetical protein